MSLDKAELGIRMAKTFKRMGSYIGNSIREREIDIHMEQLIILEILYNEGSMIQQELADRLKKDKSTILRAVDALEKKQYVVRVPDVKDRRKNNLVLTKTGADIYLKGLEVETDVIKSAIKGLSDDQLQVFSDFIDVMSRNIDGKI